VTSAAAGGAGRRLVLFDVDGTLLTARQVFKAALAEALNATFGTAGPFDGFSFSGRTDPEIVRGLMHRAGLDDTVIDARMTEALARYQAALLPRLLPGAIEAKPGIPRLVEHLARDERATLGLLTGNLEGCARAKLEPLGLNPYFPFGAYGSDHEDRAALPQIAVERAWQATGRRFAAKAIVIVGDSIHDVRCGRHMGVRAVAVTSGSTSREELLAERPDALLDSLADIEAATGAILG
jgi:phosphoglycolate phosphatase-like HAD superfamily hydrolase